MSLVLDQVCIEAGGRMLFPPVTLAVAAGEIATVMGPSGAGKSSLLGFVAGVLGDGLQGRGTVHLNEVEITHLPTHRRRIGLLFQDDLLFAHLSVGGNLGFGLSPGPGRKRRIEAALAEAELPGLGGRDPASLSGGQRARVALMRTLLSEPQALLLDEPFSRLDPGLRQRFRGFVFDHARRAGLPVLLVTHDRSDADAAGGAVIELG